MKPEIHPNYKEVTVLCACGNEFITRSTYGREQIKLDVCNDCHPFYTGKQKLVDTAGRIDKFYGRYKKKETDTK
ncbi:MAG TPA: 50S ribosomal protein L31 [Gammaproteobacteria bacterium]|nr:50S ribosomal protein L31 [Gammaproteobacteria bacterium]